jgi:hypothetical protein
MSGAVFLTGWYTPVGGNVPVDPNYGVGEGRPGHLPAPPGGGGRPGHLPAPPGGGGLRPDNTLPGGGGSAGQLPSGGGGNYPSHPIEIPPGIDNSLPPIPDHTLPPGEVSPPVGPGSAAHTGYVPMYVPDDDKWHWLSVPLPHVDQGLPPGQPGSPDNTLPGGGEHPSQGLPVTPPVHPGQGLPVTPPAGGIGGTPPPRPGPQPPAAGQLPSSMRSR